ncbi:MAG TPA: MarR family transcriptional regulator [Mycobacterium sp.]|mgnify:FL=1|nr:MarR family transcriptional regulator [Mycobacterium sp.]HRD11252.1 MarR family transcriptional regulator [Mycobacterium sp.]
MKTPPDRPAAEVVGDLLDQAMDLSARFLADRAGLSASAAFVLNRVRREGPMRLTSLAAKEGVSQPSMTQLIQRLERQDLVARLADPDDGRATLIGITARGEALLEERTRIRRERLAALLSTLSAEEVCTLQLSARVASPILDRLAADADAASEPQAAQLAAAGTRSRGD